MRPDEVLFAAALRSLASWARPASTGPAGIRVDLERDGRCMFAHLDADGAVGCFVLAESIPADLARTGDDVRRHPAGGQGHLPDRDTRPPRRRRPAALAGRAFRAAGPARRAAR
ncbi:hypothetical protein, partial [Salinispora arenicola]|uniref:hypothetical protein n=1 Tax=Salinispora arenicola TaxID=168697 RepID=UPI0027DE80D9